MRPMNDTAPLWVPSAERVATAALTDFMKVAGRKAGRDFACYRDLHHWSVESMDAFWSLIWEYCAIQGQRGDTVLRDGDRMPGAAFFPDARLNFAQNLIWKSGTGDAIIARNECGETRHLSWDMLRSEVSRLQQAFKACGLSAGDRVAVMLPNVPEAVICMLAATSLGAIWSSCSPDFGVAGVIDRFAQIEPKIFIASDGYVYNGQTFGIATNVAEISTQLKPTLTVIVACIGKGAQTAAMAHSGQTLDSLMQPYSPKALTFEQLPFSHPLYILFSSGTTGKPKCIVHSAGGTLIQHAKEHRLHADLRESDRLFYFTTLSWMMWNWLVSALAVGATLVIYDGSPSFPRADALFDDVDALKITHFGTSAKFIDSLAKANVRPIATHSLASVRTIFSTGSPLAPQSFAFVYGSIKNDVHLASICGGTDIVSGFIVGVPTEPVWAGEIQGAGLSMAMDVWDETGRPAGVGVKGELVCTRPFPTMPLRFWNDAGDSSYRNAYFSKFPGVWTQGDFAEWTRHGGMIVHGRSDATLNPGGVRIGTAEIYSQIEKLDEIIEAVCIGQVWQADTRIVLFVRLAPGVMLDAPLIDKIKRTIRSSLSPRHVPARIVAVNDIPRTKSGKVSELAVRQVVHGFGVDNLDALANPEALRLYQNLPELES